MGDDREVELRRGTLFDGERHAVSISEVPGGAAYGYVFSWEGVAV